MGASDSPPLADYLSGIGMCDKLELAPTRVHDTDPRFSSRASTPSHGRQALAYLESGMVQAWRPGLVLLARDEELVSLSWTRVGAGSNLSRTPLQDSTDYTRCFPGRPPTHFGSTPVAWVMVSVVAPPM